MSNLAIFDFDGTITYKDTLIEFIKFYKGTFRLYTGLIILSPMLLLFKLKIIPNWRAKELLLTYFFKGDTADVFQKKSQEFGKSIVPRLTRPKALIKIKEHLQQGDEVIIISASAENWIQAWTNELRIQLLATKLEIKNGLLTGKLSGLNCYGKEKVNRLLEHLQGRKFDTIYAYGDTKGDKQMLEFATHPHYQYF